MEDLTKDQKVLLALIDGFTAKSGERDRWVRHEALLILIYRLIREGLFETYDVAPALLKWKRKVRFSKISQEGILDLGLLLSKNLVQRLELSTAFHNVIQAYRVVPEVHRVLEKNRDFQMLKERVMECFKCRRCGEVMGIKANGDEVLLLCPRCGYSEKVDFFNIGVVAYKSNPFFVET